MEWKSIQINKQNIKVDTGKAMLIAMPHNSDYDGFCFWHPSKLVRTGKHSNALSVSYNDEFKFKLVKYGNGKWNSRDVIKEEEIDVEEFENAFNVMNENVKAPKIVSEYETHKPKELEAKEVAIIDELKDE